MEDDVGNANLHRRQHREYVPRDPLTASIIRCAIEVHRTLGPGLLESVYARCMAYEFLDAGIQFREQVAVPVFYKKARVECGYRLDLLVADTVIVEVKSVDRLAPVHDAQLLTYLRITGLHTGLLINFKTLRLFEGVRRLRL